MNEIIESNEDYEIGTTDCIDIILQKAHIFESMGVGKIESKIFSMLFLSNSPHTGRHIEKILDLRQPEISKGTKELQARAWIRECIPSTSSGRGRPEKSYELSLPREIIFEEFKKSIEQECRNKLCILDSLKIKKIEKKEEFQVRFL